MRLLHFADLHIGADLYGKSIPGKAWNTRVEDCLRGFDALVDYAVEERVDAVIFAGDAYKAREPNQTYQREFAKRIRRLSDAGVATFLLVGNHDLPNAESRAHSLEIFRTLDVPHVSVGDTAWFQQNGFVPQILDTRSGPLQVAFVPWPQVSHLLANSEEAAGASIEQIDKLVEQAISELVEAQASHIDPDTPAIIAGHLQLAGRLITEFGGSEGWMQGHNAPRIPVSALHLENFDYAALGHMHNGAQVDAQRPCWYSGPMQAVDFLDAKTKKGFIELDLDASKPRGERLHGSGYPHLVETWQRPLLRIRIKPRDADPNDEVLAAIAKQDLTDAIVKVEVHIDRDQETLLRLPEARKALSEAHFIASFRTVLPEENRSPLPPNVQPDASSPLETLDTFLKLREVPDERRARLLAAATEIIEESEAVGV